jgi:hypothetical protein
MRCRLPLLYTGRRVVRVGGFPPPRHRHSTHPSGRDRVRTGQIGCGGLGPAATTLTSRQLLPETTQRPIRHELRAATARVWTCRCRRFKPLLRNCLHPVCGAAFGSRSGHWINMAFGSLTAEQARALNFRRWFYSSLTLRTLPQFARIVPFFCRKDCPSCSRRLKDK